MHARHADVLPVAIKVGELARKIDASAPGLEQQVVAFGIDPSQSSVGLLGLVHDGSRVILERRPGRGEARVGGNAGDEPVGAVHRAHYLTRPLGRGIRAIMARPLEA
jgi:hypothetical protein